MTLRNAIHVDARSLNIIVDAYVASAGSSKTEIVLLSKIEAKSTKSNWLFAAAVFRGAFLGGNRRRLPMGRTVQQRDPAGRGVRYQFQASADPDTSRGRAR